jgi:hypothetical protein
MQYPNTTCIDNLKSVPVLVFAIILRIFKISGTLVIIHGVL